MLLIFLFACANTAPKPTLDEGVWALKASEAVGQLQIDAGQCSISVWGSGYTTGRQPVSCEVLRNEDDVFIRFPIEFGVGAATVSARLDAAFQRFVLPLGSRSGENEIQFRADSGPLETTEAKRAMDNAEQALAFSRTLWEESVFRLEKNGELQGEVFLPADRAVELQLYSEIGVTRGRVPATLVEQGADLWLKFEIMPTLEGEEGLLILSRALNTAVLPISETPSAVEHIFTLQPGVVEKQEREQRIQTVFASGLERERTVLRHLTLELHQQAVRLGCVGFNQVIHAHSGLADLWKGYDVAVELQDEECIVKVEPLVVQYGRRIAHRYGAGDRFVEAVRKLDVQ